MNTVNTYVDNRKTNYLVILRGNLTHGGVNLRHDIVLDAIVNKSTVREVTQRRLREVGYLYLAGDGTYAVNDSCRLLENWAERSDAVRVARQELREKEAKYDAALAAMDDIDAG